MAGSPGRRKVGRGTAPLWSVVLISTALFASLSGQLSAQDLRASVLGNPQVGQPAPDFTIGYLTAGGPGPADQPFHLRGELGRRVILVFAASAASESARALWQRLASEADSVLGSGTVVAGLYREGAGPVQRLAASTAGPFKFLADSAGRVFRDFGVGADRDGIQVFVIADDGRVAYRNRRFSSEDARAWREFIQSLRAR